MKSPICEICNNRLQNTQEPAGLVWFDDYQPLPGKKLGHPAGLGWFCSEHYLAAEQLSHLKMSEALKELKDKQLKAK